MTIATAAALGIAQSASAQIAPPAPAVAVPAPALIDADNLRYPDIARYNAQEGDCVLRLEIAASGEVTNAEIASCSSPMFAAEARRYARSLRYAPPANGQAITHDVRLQWREETDRQNS